MSSLKKLLEGLELKYRLYSILTPVTMVGEVAMEVIIPLLMSRIIDLGISGGDLAYVLRTGLVMVCLSLVSLAFGCLGARFGAVASLGFSRNLRRNLFTRLQAFSFGNVDHFSTSSLVTRLTTDVTNIQNTYQMLLRICFRAPIMLVSGTFMACMINLRLSTVFFVAIPILAVVLGIIIALSYPRFRKMLAQYDDLNAKVQENLIAIRVVKSFVRTPYECEKFNNSADTLRRLQVRAEKLVILNGPVMQLLVYSCIIAALFFGGRMIVFGDMMTGQLISFITYITQILMSLMILSMIFVMLVLSRASINRIVELLDERPEITDCDSPDAGLAESVPDGSVDFKDVSFSYSKDADKAVLNDVSLHIDAGAVVGIIGGTGSSKTTLVSLIPRLYDVMSGSVSVGGIDVRNYRLKALRDDVSMVLQKNVLFSGTIRDNLKWGNPRASDEEIRAACIASDADEFVSSLPKGYDSDLGQGGVNLSGGQKQRLCIARALLKKPKILILDDSTSAVDTATDARIRKALRTTLPNTTKIIIAQRITSVQDADIIFVMDAGRIVGFGRHEELLKNNEIYREVYDSQQSQN
ncbi:MAG: ABC transporter ATP-binding protein [Treponema sp.]|nr:ABC transporter ATP-binding protein [Treponema sp.]